MIKHYHYHCVNRKCAEYRRIFESMGPQEICQATGRHITCHTCGDYLMLAKVVIDIETCGSPDKTHEVSQER